MINNERGFCMDILSIAPIDLRPDASAGAETINLYMEHMAKQGHKIRMIARTKPAVHDKVDRYYLLNKENNLEKSLAKLEKGIGWLLNPGQKYLYKTSKQIRNNVFSILKKIKQDGYYPQVVILETVSAYLWIDDVKRIFKNAKIVAVLHDIGYQGTYNRMLIENNCIKRKLRNRFYNYAKKVELMALSKIDLMFLLNVTNKNILLNDSNNLSENKMVHVSAHYIDYYKHHYKGNYDILFYGLMSRPENYMSALWFIDNVMPLLPDKFRFIVMGGKPVESLKEKASERIIITGFVTEEEVRSRFENSFCFACPLLFGSGIKTKLLTAFATGMPILTNNIGIEGISAKHGNDYYHCETAAEYSNYIQQLANDTSLYNKMEQAALSVIDRDYNLSRSKDTYEKALLSLVNERRK